MDENRLPRQLRTGAPRRIVALLAAAIGAWATFSACIIWLYFEYERGGVPWFPELLDWLSWAPLAILVAGLVALARLVRISRRAFARSSEGLLLLQQGDRDGAAAIFEELLRTRGRIGSIRMVSRWNLGLCLLLDGRLDESLAAYDAIERERFRGALRELHEGVPSYVALCHALAGRLDEARAALAEQARRRTHKHTQSWILPEAVVLCRAGAAEEALRLLDASYRALECAQGGYVLRLVRIVRAFAAARSGAARPELRAQLEPVDAREVAWAAGWPELDAWLRAERVLAA